MLPIDSQKIAGWVDEAGLFIRRYPAGRKFYDAVGGTPLVINCIVGLAILTGLVGLFTRYWYFALACAAVLAFYGIGAYIRLNEWLNLNNVEDKLTFRGLPPAVTFRGGVANVVPQYAITNSAPFDILMSIDSVSARIGNVHSLGEHRNYGLVVLQAKTSSTQSIQPIFDVPVAPSITVENPQRVITMEMSIRYGRNRRTVSRRWFLTTEILLPPALSGVPSSIAGAWNVLRNDSELIVG